jgi:hypothetical protein
MVQKTVYTAQALGVPGEFYDDSPRRVAPFILRSAAGEVAASGSISFSGNPADGDTVTIGATTYTFKTDMASANDIKLGGSQTDSISTLVKVINGTGASGTDYFAGTTTPNASASAASSGSEVTISAKTAGAAGNSVVLAATGSAMSASGSTLEGGSLSNVLPTVARAFTAGAEDNEAVIGGNGAFRGILVGPKQYANYMNLEATMSLPDGSIGQLATMGHILVQVGNAVSPDDAAVYNNVTGEISGIESSGSAPAGSTKIPNAKFILRSAAAGEIAILEITD